MLVRDIRTHDPVMRGLAQRVAADTHIQGVMTDQVIHCFEDGDVEEVAANQVGRFPVISPDKRRMGIVGLGNLTTKREDASAEDALERVLRPTR